MPGDPESLISLVVGEERSEVRLASALNRALHTSVTREVVRGILTALSYSEADAREKRRHAWVSSS